MAFMESSDTQYCNAANAVMSGACHFALTDAIVGPAGLVNATQGAVCLKPTTGSLPLRYSELGLSHSVALVGRDLDEMGLLWDCFSGADRHADPLPQEAPDMLDQLKVGIPVDWIGKERAHALTEALLRYSEGRVEAVPFNLEWSKDEAVQSTLALANSEMARAFRKPPERVPTVELPDQIVQNNTNTQANEWVNAIEELPQNIVTAVYDGNKLTEPQRSAAHSTAQKYRQTLEECMADIDVICCPLLDEPYANLNLRTMSLSLPFALAGNPILSLKIPALQQAAPAQTPAAMAAGIACIQLIGEMGRDSGLISDAGMLKPLPLSRAAKISLAIRRKLRGRTLPSKKAPIATHP